jgi:hypothetical protein
LSFITLNVVVNKKLQCKFCFITFKLQSNKCQYEKNNINTNEELNKLQALKKNKKLVTINQEIKSLTFNGVVIVSRSDSFVNAI